MFWSWGGAELPPSAAQVSPSKVPNPHELPSPSRHPERVKETTIIIIINIAIINSCLQQKLVATAPTPSGGGRCVVHLSEGVKRLLQ